MATAVFPGPNRPVLVPSRQARALPSLSQGRAVSRAGDLTIQSHQPARIMGVRC